MYYFFIKKEFKSSRCGNQVFVIMFLNSTPSGRGTCFVPRRCRRLLRPTLLMLPLESELQKTVCESPLDVQARVLIHPLLSAGLPVSSIRPFPVTGNSPLVREEEMCDTGWRSEGGGDAEEQRGQRSTCTRVVCSLIGCKQCLHLWSCGINQADEF